jgi:hypothetical protein
MAKQTEATTPEVGEIVVRPKYKVAGLVAYKNNTMPIKYKGRDIDLAKASQEALAELYKAKLPYVILE